MQYKYRKLILYSAIGIMGLGMATFTLSSLPSGSEPKTVESANFKDETLIKDEPSPSIFVAEKTPTIHSPSPTPTLIPTPTIIENKLEYDAYPEINELLTSFLNAKLDSTNTFEDLVLNATLIDIESYQKKTEYIKAYHNIHCYTKKGINEIDFVAYLVYEAELPTIQTYAPSIEELYITKDQSEHLWIYFGEIDTKTQESLKQMREQSDVSELIESVNQSFQEALEEDSALNDFFQNLTSSTVK